jgi:calcineurin-like phosphoesterase family protein
MRRVIVEVEGTCRKYALVPFKIGGFHSFRNPDANWLCLDVEPSPELEQLRYELAQNLIRSEKLIHNTCQSFDRCRKFEFHYSVWKYIPRDKDKFERLVNFAETRCGLEAFKRYKAPLFQRLFNLIKKYIFRTGEEGNSNINLHLLRVTVLGRQSHIQGEYDLLLKKTFSRWEALNPYWYRKTIEALKIELSPPHEERLSLSNASNCFFIGDTHFDHKNTIIKFIHRPFSNVTKMNEAMKNNWNRSVGDGDRVYFLGDYTGPPSRDLKNYYEQLGYWAKQLNGGKVSILGNHDRNGGCLEFEKARILEVGQLSFLLIHNPSDKKIRTIRTRHDWIIHGHVHNNEMDRYPFINGEQKTINVSAELINYKPVSLSYLLSLNLDSIKRMRTIDSQPERW